MSENWVYSWQWKSSRIRQQFYRQESFAMNMDTHMSGSTVKNQILLKKRYFEYSVIRKISYQSWFLVYQRVLPQACPLQHPWHLQGRKLIIPSLLQARLLHHPWHPQPSQAKVWIGKNGETRSLLKHQKSCWINQPKSPNQVKMRIMSEYGRPVSFRHTRMAARTQRESCGWKSSGTGRLTRELFSWTIFRVFEKCGFG